MIDDPHDMVTGLPAFGSGLERDIVLFAKNSPDFRGFCVERRVLQRPASQALGLGFGFNFSSESREPRAESRMQKAA